MDVSKLKYDEGRIFSALKELPNDSVIATEPLDIYIPKRFENSKLATVGTHVESILMIGVVVKDRYAFIGALTTFTCTPGDINEITINNERYYVFHFEAGETVIDRKRQAQESLMGYTYYIEFIKYARIPWYATYEQIAQLLDEAKYFTGKSTGNSNSAIRVLFSLTARAPENLEIPFRYSPSLNNVSIEPKVVGVNNPGLLLSGTFSRLFSGYLNESIVAGSLEENTKISSLERIMKGSIDDNQN